MKGGASCNFPVCLDSRLRCICTYLTLTYPLQVLQTRTTIPTVLCGGGGGYLFVKTSARFIEKPAADFKTSRHYLLQGCCQLCKIARSIAQAQKSAAAGITGRGLVKPLLSVLLDWELLSYRTSHTASEHRGISVLFLFLKIGKTNEQRGIILKKNRNALHQHSILQFYQATKQRSISLLRDPPPQQTNRSTLSVNFLSKRGVMIF